jgi:hypothetical protein
VQATHLKRWTFLSLLRSDILERAVPWTRLILRRGRLPADLNLTVSSRLSALAAWTMAVCLALGLVWPWAWLGALLSLAAVGGLNADLYRFFARRGGGVFALGAAALHILYLLYSSLVFFLLAAPVWLARVGPLLLLLATLLKGLTWSVVVPPWHAPDENTHFLYGQFIERFHTLHPAPDAWRPAEVGQLWVLAQLPEVRYHRSTPLDLSDRAAIAEQIALLDAPATRWTYTRTDDRSFAGFRSFTSFHPPLYYIALAVVQGTLENRSILVRNLAGRWLSTALGLLVVALAYRAGRDLWPRRPGRALLLGVLVSFQPMNTFCTAILGNGALEITLFSACLLLSLRVIRRGLTWQRGLALGILTGLGLLTKISFLGILPVLGLSFIWEAVRLRRNGRALWSWALVALAPALLGGWWYKDALLSGGDTLVSSFGAGVARPTLRLLPYLLHYGWLTVYRRMLLMYWGNFGWLDTPLPDALRTLLTWATIVAVWTAGWRLIRAWASPRPRIPAPPRPRVFSQSFALFFLGCATLGVVAFYTYVSFRAARNLGGEFGMQGRYFLPPIVAQMAWLVVGLTGPASGRLRRVWAWLVGAGMVALNLYALLGVIAPRYYGAGGLLVLLERATVLQPVGAATLVALCGALLATTALLLVALWGAEDE